MYPTANRNGFTDIIAALSIDSSLQQPTCRSDTVCPVSNNVLLNPLRMLREPTVLKIGLNYNIIHSAQYEAQCPGIGGTGEVLEHDDVRVKVSVGGFDLMRSLAYSIDAFLNVLIQRCEFIQ